MFCEWHESDDKVGKEVNQADYFHKVHEVINNARCLSITSLIPLHEKILQFDWLRAVVFQLNLKYRHVKITNLLWVVV